MRAAIVLVVMGLAFVATTAAGTRKVLVLPLDGNAPAAQRTKLNASVVKMAKKNLAGEVTIGDTTFAETAAAVGCDPKSDECAQTVLATLAVDELVYGSATKDGKQVTITVKRVQKGSAPTSQSTTIATTDSADKAEPGLEGAFTATAPPPPPPNEGSGSAEGLGSGSAVETPRPRPAQGLSFFDTKERKLGVAFTGGGVISLVVGISFWVSKASLQDQIDAHATRTVADFNDLQNLEDQAGRKALLGNIFVVVGIGLGATGGYFLYKDHQNRSATVAPAPVEGGGMTLNFGGLW